MRVYSSLTPASGCILKTDWELMSRLCLEGLGCGRPSSTEEVLPQPLNLSQLWGSHTRSGAHYLVLRPFGPSRGSWQHWIKPDLLLVWAGQLSLDDRGSH